MYIHRGVRIARVISPLASLQGCNLRRSALNEVRSRPIRGLSVLPRFRSLSTVPDLRKRIQEELEYENENDTTKSYKDSVESYLKGSSWMIEETPGKKYVKFIKTHGKNKITLVIDVGTAVDENEAKSYMDEDYEDDNEVDEGEEGDDMEGESQTEVLKATAIIENTHKPAKGALAVSLTVEDDEFYVQKVQHFKDPKQALSLPQQKPAETSAYYTGPQFYTLDNDLQELYREYLTEIGLNPDFAKFLYSYSIAKEYKEYITWLNHTRDFFEE